MIISRIALIYLFWVVAVFFMQRSILYPRSAANASVSQQSSQTLPDPRIMQLWIDPEPGVSVESWLYLPSTSPTNRGLVLFLHGNAELIDGGTYEAENWLSRGYAVLAVEYRGYGRSGGSPSQKAIISDVLESLALARTKLPDPDLPILIHGRSLGTGVAAQVAALLQERNEPASHIIFESPFLSITSFSWGFGVPGFLVRDSYRTDRVIHTFTSPVLILSANADEIVPAAHGRELASMAKDATYLILEGSHNSGLSYMPEYWAAIDKFLPINSGTP